MFDLKSKFFTVIAFAKLRMLYRKEADLWLELIETAREDVRVRPVDDMHYGDAHWRVTAAIGLYLTRRLPATNPAIVMAFAILHDSQRFDRLADPTHGARAAQVARLSAPLRGLMDADDVARVMEACQFHSGGLVSQDPTIGACWDADRLAMVQRGRVPHAAYMSTNMCRDNFEDVLTAARLLCAAPPSWAVLVAAVSARPRRAKPSMRVSSLRASLRSAF